MTALPLDVSTPAAMGPVEPLWWKSRAGDTALVCAPVLFVDEDMEARRGSGACPPELDTSGPSGAPVDAPWTPVGRVREDPGLARPGPLAQPCAFQAVGQPPRASSHQDGPVG